MKSIGSTLYLECADMKRVGVGYNTLKSARKRGTAGYTIIDDPADKRRILVAYNDLRPDVKQVVDAVFGNAIKDQGQSDLLSLLETRSEDVQTLRDHILADGTRLTDEAIEKYVRACSYLRLLGDTPRAVQKHLGYPTVQAWHQAITACFSAEGVDLPRTYAPMRRKLREFAQQGALAVVSGKWGNSNRRIIAGAIEDFLISVYALPTKPDVEKVMVRYAEVAKEKGWPMLSREAVWTHLHRRPEVKRRWYLGRHGKAAWNALYSHENKRSRPTFREAMWCSDGTKLNLFYRTAGKVPMAAKMQVYVVMDVYSEVILGWSLGWSERFDMQQAAMRQALTRSQAKPLQLLYDGQGGHKKADAQDFFDRATKLHFPSQPRNPQAKMVESLIGRWQKEVLRDEWYFTGQNIQSKRLDSKPNIDFIQAHINDLPGVEELPAIVERLVDQWNNREHPHFKMSRNMAYDTSINPHAVELDVLDMVNLFWHITAQPIRYRKNGITLQVGEQRHTFEVYDADGHPDEEFRARHIGSEFLVKYDLEDFSYVMLYESRPDGIRFVTAAQAKQVVAMAVVDLKPGDRAIIDHSLALRKREIARTWKELEAHTDSSGIDADTLIHVANHYTVDKAELANAQMKLATVSSSAADDDDDDELFNPYANL